MVVAGFRSIVVAVLPEVRIPDTRDAIDLIEVTDHDQFHATRADIARLKHEARGERALNTKVELNTIRIGEVCVDAGVRPRSARVADVLKGVGVRDRVHQTQPYDIGAGEDEAVRLVNSIANQFDGSAEQSVGVRENSTSTPDHRLGRLVYRVSKAEPRREVQI